MATGLREDFRVVLPDGWHRLDLAPGSRDASIRRIVRRSWGNDEELAGLRHRLFMSYREMAEAAVEQGVFFCALLQDSIDGLPISGSLLAFLGTSPVRPDGEPFASVEEMADLLAVAKDGEQPISCRVVDLPLGRAVEFRSISPMCVVDADGDEVRADGVRYFIPVDGDRLLILAFSTPILPLGDALAELFAGIAHTARLAPR